MTATAGVIRTSVNNRVDSELIRASVATQCRRRAVRLRGRFFANDDHGAHSRYAPAMQSLQTRASNQRTTLARATCERRDHGSLNRARRRPRRCRRPYRHERSE